MVKKVFVTILLIALLLLTILPALTGRAVTDSSLNESNGEQMWTKLGIVRGYSDNTLRLQEHITKAEFITLINRSLELEGSGIIQFKDVQKNDWFYSEVSTALAIGYLKNEDYFFPGKQMTYLDIVPVLYNLYGFDPAQKDYLTALESLPEMSEELKSQLNTLVKENILRQDHLQELKPITRRESLSLIKNLVRERFTGSLLNIESDVNRETFQLLNLDPKQYYFYGLSDILDLRKGRTPSNPGDEELGRLIMQRISECAQKNSVDDKGVMPPSVFIDRDRTHIYYVMADLKEDYIAYKTPIITEKDGLTVGDIEQVLHYDRSEIVAVERENEERERLMYLERQLKSYIPMAEELNLSHSEYLLYSPDQLSSLLLKDAEPFTEFSSEAYQPILKALENLQFKHYNGGDLPFAYWVARDASNIYAIKVKPNGYYGVYQLVFQSEADSWIITEVQTSLKAPTEISNNRGYQIAQKLKELGVDESEYYHAPRRFTESEMPVLASNADIMMKLEMTRLNLINLGGKGSIYPMYWIHLSGREAYGGTTKNDTDELIVMKFNYIDESNIWLSQQVWPIFKETVYPISQADSAIIERLGIDQNDYLYYPYDKRTIFAFNQGGPLVDQTWNFGEQLAKVADRGFGIQFEYDDNYPNFLIQKDGSKAYTLRKSLEGEEQVYLHRKEWVLYERKGDTIVYPIWSTQQVMPITEPEVFEPPAEYLSIIVKELKLNIQDYIYYPVYEQQKLATRYPSLFGDSTIAGSMAFYKGGQLLREHGISLADKDMGCFIHSSGNHVYAIQQKTDGITYIYKLELSRTPEGYVVWNDVSEWKIGS